MKLKSYLCPLNLSESISSHHFFYVFTIALFYLWWCQTNPNYSPKVPSYKSSLHKYAAKNPVIFDVSL